jgi:polyhydroxybutyrate depolymerase
MLACLVFAAAGCGSSSSAASGAGGTAGSTGGAAGQQAGGAAGQQTGGAAGQQAGGAAGQQAGGAAGQQTGGAAGQRAGGAGGHSTGGAAGTSAGGAACATTGAAPVPSSGCAAAMPPAGGKATIDVSGTTREYILTLPAGYDPHHPYPLLLAFHGGQYDDQWVVDGKPPQSGPYYGIQAEAHDTAILVAPQALSESWTNQGGRDIAYVNAMVARFESQLCVDQSRIFATGFSMGGIMTIAVGCNASATFRAVAAMSGEIMNGCPDTRPIPYWSSHGTSDPTIPIAMGQAARDAYVQRNHCSTQTVATTPTGCVAYQGCDPGAPVIWCPFDGVHQPPPFAGPAIWGFFAQF